MNRHVDNLVRPGASSAPTNPLAFLWRGRFVIAALTLLGGVAGVVMAERRGTVWRARSVLYVQRDAAVMPGSDVSVWLQSRNYANTQAALLRSTPVLQRGIERSGVDHGGLFGESKNHLAWLRRHLDVAVGNEDDLITVALDSVLVDDACTLVNAIVDEYLTFRAQNQRETAAEVLLSLRSELRRYEEEMQSLQQEQVSYLEAHPGVDPAGLTATVQAERRRELAAARTRAEIDAMQAEAAWVAAQRQAEAGDPVQCLSLPGTDPALIRATTEAMQRLQAMQERRLQLLAEVTAEHPSVRELQGAIDGMQALVSTDAQRIAAAQVALLEQRCRAAQRLQAELAVRVGDEEARLRAIDPVQAGYRQLEIRFDRTRKVADALYERVRSIDINADVDSAERPPLSALVYEQATPGGAAVASSKTSIAAIATFVGLLLGLSVAWVRSLLDQRVRSAADLGGQVPLLSSLPRIGGLRRGLLAAYGRSPALSAAMRSLHTVLQFGVRGRGQRVLQVTSAGNGEGKSTIAAGLGVAMARAGMRTVLIDADLEHPAQAALFGVDGSIGLCDVLAGRVSVAAAAVPTPIPGLRLLPAGRCEPGGEPLDAGRLQGLLRELGADCDRILIDSPALLSSVDARIVTAVSDCALLVVRAMRTNRSMVEAAIAVIAAVAGRLGGAVLNGCPRAAAGIGGVAAADLTSPDVAAGSPGGRAESAVRPPLARTREGA